MFELAGPLRPVVLQPRLSPVSREEHRRAHLQSDERIKIFYANGCRLTKPKNTENTSVSRWWARTPVRATGSAAERR
jgi:hypothetical protein